MISLIPSSTSADQIHLNHASICHESIFIEATKRNIKVSKRGAMSQSAQVSIFYSGGEICDVTGKPRKIEVKKERKQNDSPPQFSIFNFQFNSR